MLGEKAKGYLFPTNNLEYADRCYTRDPLIGQKLTVSLNYMKTEIATPKEVVYLCPRPLLLSCLGLIAERRFGKVCKKQIRRDLSKDYFGELFSLL